MRASSRVLAAVALLGLGFATHADTLLMEGIQAAEGAGRPVRGMSMTSVEAQFGVPRAKYDAVGDPPISRWDYSGFVVYFEYEYVIHAVVPRSAPAAN